MNMKTISLLELYEYNYSITTINALRQYWTLKKDFDCIGVPKKLNMLLYLDGCKAVYTLKNGGKIFADSGAFVYIPLQSEYHVQLYDFETEDSSTVGVNFLLFDSDNMPFIICDKITVFRFDNADYKALFNKLDTYSESPVICVGKIKSLMYDLIFRMSEFHKKLYTNKYSIISKGISYLEEDEEQLLSISEVAKLCNVSEAYFRKLFKSYSGSTPLEYRMSSKIYKAKNYLLYDNLSVTEISDRLGFTDASYFIKQFHQKTGMTPCEYRKKFINNRFYP